LVEQALKLGELVAERADDALAACLEIGREPGAALHDEACQRRGALVDELRCLGEAHAERGDDALA
jgi:hypothetical protein